MSNNWQAYAITFTEGGRIQQWIRFAPTDAHAEQSARDDIGREYPGATFVRAERCADPREAINWMPTTKERYHEMLGILPPIEWRGGAFLVGEPMDSCPTTGRERFTAYRQQGDRFTVASRPLTVLELRETMTVKTENA